MLGFIAASAIGTWFVGTVSAAEAKATIGVVNDLRTWFLILAFVSIGLQLRVSALREAGWRPVAVFGGAAVANLAIGLGLAALLFTGFTV
ncbi:putative sulfate exporter family transporter [Catellatospora bangladeshensis]|uniref:putative sulfate exporter family transporter n=1 Tax=Catellatospora bangladeshensis TaxID=310355 RepID=UPI003623F380